MWRLALRRGGLTLISLAAVVIASFTLVHLVPGDPVDLMLGETASLEDKASLRHELNLDLPWPEEIWHRVAALARLDLGRSLVSRTPVAQTLAQHFGATAELALAALVFSLLWSVPIGVLAAIYKESWFDHVTTVVIVLLVSVPGIFLGPLLIYTFAIRLEILPVSDRGDLAHLILPALSLALPLGAVSAKMIRSALIDVLGEDYMRTARAKGLAPMALYVRHALTNAVTPTITVVGLQVGALLTGTVITETIFDWPGLGLLLLNAIQRRDYPLVQGAVLFTATLYILINLLTDLAYGLANPRLRSGHE